MITRLCALVFWVAAHVVPAAAAAQRGEWSLMAEAGWAGTSGVSRDMASGAAFRPANGLVLGLGVRRDAGLLAFGLLLRTQGSDLAIADSQITIITSDLGFRRYEIAPELGVRLVRLSRFATVGLAGGPVVDLWRVTDSKSRTRLGARAVLTLESTIADGVSGVIRAEGAVTGSMFDEGELPPEFDRRRAVRGVVTVGVSVSLN